MKTETRANPNCRMSPLYELGRPYYRTSRTCSGWRLLAPAIRSSCTLGRIRVRPSRLERFATHTTNSKESVVRLETGIPTCKDDDASNLIHENDRARRGQVEALSSRLGGEKKQRKLRIRVKLVHKALTFLHSSRAIQPTLAYVTAELCQTLLDDVQEGRVLAENESLFLFPLDFFHNLDQLPEKTSSNTSARGCHSLRQQGTPNRSNPLRVYGLDTSPGRPGPLTTSHRHRPRNSELDSPLTVRLSGPEAEECRTAPHRRRCFFFLHNTIERPKKQVICCPNPA